MKVDVFSRITHLFYYSLYNLNLIGDKQNMQIFITLYYLKSCDIFSYTRWHLTNIGKMRIFQSLTNYFSQKFGMSKL